MQNIAMEEDPGLRPRPCRPRPPGNNNSTITELKHTWQVCTGLHRLQQNRTFCDITIKVGDTSFEAHKAVLASNSDFFHTMFTSGFQESHASEATIAGKPEAFKILLDFSYSGKLVVPSNETTTVMDVLKMAHYLQYNLVVVRCEEALLQNFHQCTINHVLQMMSESDVFGLGKLKTKCKQYLAQNFNGSEEFLQCMTSELIVETLNHKDFNVMDEKKVFNIIVTWLKHDWEVRKEFAPLLFQSIRLGAVPSGHLTVTFLQSPELNTIPECQQLVVRVMQLLDSKKYDDPPLSVSHPTLFETRSTVTAIIKVHPLHGSCYFAEGGWNDLTKLPMLPTKDFSNTSDNCVVADAQLYVARGTRQNPRHLIYPQFLLLDKVTKKWKTLTAMTNRRERCCLVPLGRNHIYAIGGMCGGVGIKECEVFLIDENRWREIAPMPCALRKVYLNSAVAHNGKILVYGEAIHDGNNNYNNVNRMMMYNPTLNTWCVLTASASQSRPFTLGLAVQDRKCYRIYSDARTGFIIQEVILVVDRNNMMRCTSNTDQTQSQDAIPVTFRKEVFRIDEIVYVLCGGGYHKTDIKVSEVGCVGNRLEDMRIVGVDDCATTFRFDKALWV
ncbi:kelch-like protein 25 [Amphiura filiformis]|uniref:kelch-like protein 25 n=1 Tax=Amphiura filiformis TaxID=82378 RepID=UPI003B20E1D9